MSRMDPGSRAVAVQRLQRSHGNRAVGRLIGAGTRMVARLVAFTAHDHSAMAEQLHEAMAGWGTDEEGIYVVLQKLQKDPAAIAELKRTYRARYNEDLEAEIRSEMSGSELRLALELLGVTTPPQQPAVGAAPTTDQEYKRSARRLYAAMKGLGTDEEAIYAVLIPLHRDRTATDKLKAVYSAELGGGLTGNGLEEDLKDEMSGSELAYALYLLNAPPPAAPHAWAPASTGTEVHSGAVPGGQVSVRTGGQLTAGGPSESFQMGYTGGLASDSHWLQFIWREIVVTHPTKGVYALPDPITTSGGHYALTTDPDDPVYNTDSRDPENPFYEAAFANNRTADSTTIFDLPGSINALVQREFSNGATSVVSRAHFNTYLVRDFRATYHVYLQVEWSYGSPAVPARVQTVRAAGRVNSLPAGMRKRLIEQRPRFAYIQ
jgi:hypothetical protein